MAADLDDSRPRTGDRCRREESSLDLGIAALVERGCSARLALDIVR